MRCPMSIRHHDNQFVVCKDPYVTILLGNIFFVSGCASYVYPSHPTTTNLLCVKIHMSQFFSVIIFCLWLRCPMSIRHTPRRPIPNIPGVCYFWTSASNHDEENLNYWFLISAFGDQNPKHNICLLFRKPNQDMIN